METALSQEHMAADQDRKIDETVAHDQARLRNFIRRRVPDEAEVEDILQDVLYELVEAYRMMKPLEQVTSWLFQVARNRIIDLFRKKKSQGLSRKPPFLAEEIDGSELEDLLPSSDRGPEAA